MSQKLTYLFYVRASRARLTRCADCCVFTDLGLPDGLGFPLRPAGFLKIWFGWQIIPISLFLLLPKEELAFHKSANYTWRVRGFSKVQKYLANILFKGHVNLLHDGMNGAGIVLAFM